MQRVRTSWRIYVQIALLGLAASSPVVAQENKQQLEPHLTQLAHKSWRISDGSLPYSPNALAQTKDGYLWIATDVELLRFDGVRFVAFKAPGLESINQVVSLLADRDGSLWVGARSGVFHLQDGRFRPLKRRIRANQMVQLPSGEIWFAATGREAPGETGALCKIVKDDYTCAAGEISTNAGQTLVWDGSDGLWVGFVQTGICHWTPAFQTCSSEQDGGPWKDSVYILARSPTGDIWFGAKDKDTSPWLGRYSNGVWTNFPALPGADASTMVLALSFDRSGNLWVGTSNRGAYRMASDGTEHISTQEGLSSNSVSDLLFDAEKTMWVVTSDGIDHFYERPIETWSIREGLTADSVSAVSVGASGMVYFGNEGALDILENGSIHSIKAGQGLPGQTVQGMTVDRTDQLWLGLDGKLFTYDGAAFRERTLPRPQDDDPVITELQQDIAGSIWVRSTSDKYRIDGDTAVLLTRQLYGTGGDFAADPESGVWACAKGQPPAHFVGNDVRIRGENPGKTATSYPIALAFKGYVWCGTSDGMVAWKDGKARTLGPGNGLPSRRIYAAIVDHGKNLWLMTERSYVEVLSADLDTWLQNDAHAVHVNEYGTEDGAHTGMSTFGPSAQLAPNGDLWFATDRFAQRIRPGALSLNELPPPIAVETVHMDGRSQNAAEDISVPPRTHTLQIDYTALSYINPGLVAFRYKVDGVDDEWQDVGPRRQAIYTDLSPGSYAFHVSARNSDGVWSTRDASLSFSVQPAFYQTWWFRLLALIAAVAAVAIFYRHRKELITRSVRERLYERIAERERIAREIHDTFFQGIQGLLLRFQTGLSSLAKDDPARPIFQEALEQSDEVMLEGRELVLDLRERLDDAKTLPDVLQAVGEDLVALHSSKFSLNVTGKAQAMEPIAREELFRIGKEALLNAFRHAQASLIRVEIDFGPEQFTLRVHDDGRGVDTSVIQRGRRAGHWGLPGMRERAEGIGGTFAVNSTPGSGTELTITLPAASAYARLTSRRLFVLKPR